MSAMFLHYYLASDLWLSAGTRDSATTHFVAGVLIFTPGMTMRIWQGAEGIFCEEDEAGLIKETLWGDYITAVESLGEIVARMAETATLTVLSGDGERECGAAYAPGAWPILAVNGRVTGPRRGQPRPRRRWSIDQLHRLAGNEAPIQDRLPTTIP